MTVKSKTLGLAPKKDDEPKLPEDEVVGLSETEVKEQLGHMTIQLLQTHKIADHLRKVISDLRKELSDGS